MDANERELQRFFIRTYPRYSRFSSSGDLKYAPLRSSPQFWATETTKRIAIAGKTANFD